MARRDGVRPRPADLPDGQGGSRGGRGLSSVNLIVMTITLDASKIGSILEKSSS
jgi:hypothetical protein